MKLKQGDRVMIPAIIGHESDDPDCIRAEVENRSMVFRREFVERAVSERRERIVTAAMQGIMANIPFGAGRFLLNAEERETVVENSILIADALIAALDKND